MTDTNDMDIAAPNKECGHAGASQLNNIESSPGMQNYEFVDLCDIDVHPEAPDMEAWLTSMNGGQIEQITEQEAEDDPTLDEQVNALRTSAVPAVSDLEYSTSQPCLPSPSTVSGGRSDITPNHVITTESASEVPVASDNVSEENAERVNDDIGVMQPSDAEEARTNTTSDIATSETAMSCANNCEVVPMPMEPSHDVHHAEHSQSTDIGASNLSTDNVAIPNDVIALNDVTTLNDVTVLNDATTSNDVVKSNHVTTSNDVAISNEVTASNDVTLTNDVITSNDVPSSNEAATSNEIATSNGVNTSNEVAASNHITTSTDAPTSIDVAPSNDVIASDGVIELDNVNTKAKGDAQESAENFLAKMSKLKLFNVVLKLQKDMAALQLQMSIMQDGLRVATSTLEDIVEHVINSTD